MSGMLLAVQLLTSQSIGHSGCTSSTCNAAQVQQSSTSTQSSLLSHAMLGMVPAVVESPDSVPAVSLLLLPGDSSPLPSEDWALVPESEPDPSDAAPASAPSVPPAGNPSSE